jgi:hypothetical protein
MMMRHLWIFLSIKSIKMVKSRIGLLLQSLFFQKNLNSSREPMQPHTESKWQIFFALLGFGIFFGLLLIAAGMCDK